MVIHKGKNSTFTEWRLRGGGSACLGAFMGMSSMMAVRVRQGGMCDNRKWWWNACSEWQWKHGEVEGGQTVSLLGAAVTVEVQCT